MQSQIIRGWINQSRLYRMKKASPKYTALMFPASTTWKLKHKNTDKYTHNVHCFRFYKHVILSVKFLSESKATWSMNAAVSWLHCAVVKELLVLKRAINFASLLRASEQYSCISGLTKHPRVSYKRRSSSFISFYKGCKCVCMCVSLHMCVCVHVLPM